MKIKYFAAIAFAAGIMLSSCGDDEVVKKNPYNPAKKPVESTTPDDGGNGGSGNPVADVKLSEYVAQDAFELSDVTITKATYNASTTYQKVEGLGGMLNVATWGTPTPNTAQIDLMYKDWGYRILRLYIYPNKNEWKLNISEIQRAVSHGALILACPWEAPSNMVETVNEIVWNDGQREQLQQNVKHLKQKNWEAYADHLIEYVAYMKKQGIPIYAMSVQNEPDAEFMYWSPKEIAQFTKEYGEYIVEETGVKLITPEACGMREDHTNQIINNKDAFAATDIIAGHLYQGFSNIYGTAHNNGYVKNRYNYINGLWDRIKNDGKQWWMTEHLFNDGEKSKNPSDWQFLNWDYCLNHLGLEIHDCMAASCSAYVYWYIKRFYGLIYDNDKEGRSGNNKENTYSHNAFIMAQWAGYATGKTRIQASCGDKDIRLTAYKSDDGRKLSFVAINFSDQIKYLTIEMDTEDYLAYGLTCDESSQTKQALTKVRPNCFGKQVVLAIPEKGIGSMTVIK